MEYDYSIHSWDLFNGLIKHVQVKTYSFLYDKALVLDIDKDFGKDLGDFKVTSPIFISRS